MKLDAGSGLLASDVTELYSNFHDQSRNGRPQTLSATSAEQHRAEQPGRRLVPPSMTMHGIYRSGDLELRCLLRKGEGGRYANLKSTSRPDQDEKRNEVRRKVATTTLLCTSDT